MAQRMLRELFGDARSDDRRASPGRRRRAPRAESREPSAEEQRENLTFALATRAVEALEDLALNVAAIRQRLERRPRPRPPEDTGRRTRASRRARIDADQRCALRGDRRVVAVPGPDDGVAGQGEQPRADRRRGSSACR